MRHVQIFVRAEVRKPLLTVERADAFLRAAVAAAGMNVIGGPWGVLGVIPGNEGVSATAILDFSSTSLHEWPGHSPWPLLHFDLYTCSDPPVLERFETLFSELEPISYKAVVLDRDGDIFDQFELPAPRPETAARPVCW